MDHDIKKKFESIYTGMEFSLDSSGEYQRARTKSDFYTFLDGWKYAKQDMDDWICVETDPPREFEVILTFHIDDLFPVCAFYLIENNRRLWLREIEGPEDDVQLGKMEELFRPPTHWKPVPDSPIKE